jgi:hypothetical protein
LKRSGRDTPAPERSAADGEIVKTTRELGEIASNLDDLSLTLEEIKDEAVRDGGVEAEKLEEIQAGIRRATQMIEQSLDPEPADGR